jgi:hypothetical protein
MNITQVIGGAFPAAFPIGQADIEKRYSAAAPQIKE